MRAKARNDLSRFKANHPLIISSEVFKPLKKLFSLAAQAFIFYNKLLECSNFNWNWEAVTVSVDTFPTSRHVLKPLSISGPAGNKTLSIHSELFTFTAVLSESVRLYSRGQAGRRHWGRARHPETLRDKRRELTPRPCSGPSELRWRRSRKGNVSTHTLRLGTLWLAFTNSPLKCRLYLTVSRLTKMLIQTLCNDLKPSS